MSRGLNSLIGRYTYYAIQTARQEPVREALRELEVSQNWSRERLLTLQWERLKALLEQAYQIPFYKERFAAAGLKPSQIHTPADYARLPILTKQEVREHPEKLRVAGKEPMDVVLTSGSSGMPLTIWRNRASTGYARAAMYRAHRWHGLEVGDKELRLWGEPVQWKSRWMEKFKDRLMNRSRMNVFALPDRWVQAFYAEIQRQKPHYVFGYATLIDRFARQAQAEHLDLQRFPLRTIKTTSEPLRPEQAQRLERLFGCSVLNEYGCTECGIISTTCRHGRMHLTPETTYVELVPLAGSDWFRVVVTDLHNTRMPLLRYEVGDLARPAGEKQCPCGMELPLLGEIAGRKTELIEIPGGKTVHSLVLYYTICGMEQQGLSVRQARLIQTSPKQFVCQIIPEKKHAGTEEFLHKRLLDHLGHQVQLDVESVDALPQMPNGKNADFVKAF